METIKKEKNPTEFFIGLLTGEGIKVFSQTHLLFEKMKKKKLSRKVK